MTQVDEHITVEMVEEICQKNYDVQWMIEATKKEYVELMS